jgi:hypothetical protein
MNDAPPLFDFAFFIRLLLGAAVGGLLGWGITFFFGAPWLVIAVPALIFGLLSAFFGDDFWRPLGSILAELIFWW